MSNPYDDEMNSWIDDNIDELRELYEKGGNSGFMLFEDFCVKEYRDRDGREVDCDKDDEI